MRQEPGAAFVEARRGEPAEMTPLFRDDIETCLEAGNVQLDHLAEFDGHVPILRDQKSFRQQFFVASREVY
jgi:hypothetical protein